MTMRLYRRPKNRLNRNRTDCIGRLGIVGFLRSNSGANQMDRIKKGMYQTLVLLIGICIVIAAGIVLFRNQLLGLFLDKTQAAEAIAIGSKYLTIVCVAHSCGGYENIFERSSRCG